MEVGEEWGETQAEDVVTSVMAAASLLGCPSPADSLGILQLHKSSP